MTQLFKNKLRTLQPQNGKIFQNSQPQPGIYWFLYKKKECICQGYLLKLQTKKDEEKKGFKLHT